MDYLGRDAAPFGEDLWRLIDEAVVSAASETLVGRRFLPFLGPIGPGLNAVEITSPDKAEIFKDGFSVMEGRELKKVPQLYEDFWLYWRDLEGNRRGGLPVDVNAARYAAQRLAKHEDSMIFYGIKEFGYEGLLTAEGAGVVKKGEWGKGEEAFTAVAKGLAALQGKGKQGNYALVMSPDMYVALHRIQLGAGVLELDRVKGLVGGRIFSSAVLQPGTALLVCAQPQYMDLMVGQDIAAAYTEMVDLNHHFRVLETAILRIKSAEAIVLFQ